MTSPSLDPNLQPDKPTESGGWWSLWLGFVMGLSFAAAVAVHEHEGLWFDPPATKREPAAKIVAVPVAPDNDAGRRNE